MKRLKVFVQIVLCCALSVRAASASGHPNQPLPTTGIPFARIAPAAGQQYSGDGLAVLSSPDGARLRCVFQRINACVAAEGASLVSTAEGAKGEPFRVIARMLGRARTEPIALSGNVEVTGQVARFVRPGFTEEYSVNVDGLRQDFVIERRPPGTSADSVRLELTVDGAKAEAMADGAWLTLADGGRRMLYNRIKAEDMRGKELNARLKVISAQQLAIVLDDAAAEYPVRIDPTFSDANWYSLAALQGVRGSISATAMDSFGNLYFGGSFTNVGNILATNIVEWTGVNWLPLGSGLNDSVNTLAVSGTTLYAGGFFTAAGSVPTSYIAQWDGNAWSAVGPGMGNVVSALAVSGTNLYAGGAFSDIGALSAHGIARWNGSTWSTLGSGISVNGFNPVSAMAVSGTNLYVGGFFTNAGGVAATNIARWDGTAWWALGSGMNSLVEALLPSGNTLYAAGYFTTAGGVAATNIAQWNGSAWSQVGGGFNSGFGNPGVGEALAMLNGTLYAAGSFNFAGSVLVNNIAQWNGSTWSPLGGGFTSAPGPLLALGNNLLVVRNFTTGSSVATNYISFWNGNAWSGTATGVSSNVNALAISGNNLYVGGMFTNAGGASANYVAEWNGSSWSALGSGFNERVYALAAASNTLYAGGLFTTAGGGSANYIAQWNGISWSAMGSGMSAPVLALAVAGTNLYAGGAFFSAGGVTANEIARWDGSSWSPLGSGISGRSVYALAVSGSTLYAGGSFTTAGGVSVADIAQWNGSSWSAMGSGIPDAFGFGSIVSALAVSGNILYAGGNFTTAGGVTANHVAQWNGTAWSALGGGVNATVQGLAVSGNALIAGGIFNMAEGQPANYVAQWNGSAWSALGSGVNNWVTAVVAAGDRVFVGGSFTTAGTNVCGYVAEAIVWPQPYIVTDNGDFGINSSRSQFGFDVAGGTGQKLVVQGTTNLSSWVPVQTNVLTAPLWHFKDASAGGVRSRYYRILDAQ